MVKLLLVLNLEGIGRRHHLDNCCSIFWHRPPFWVGVPRPWSAQGHQRPAPQDGNPLEPAAVDPVQGSWLFAFYSVISADKVIWTGGHQVALGSWHASRRGV